MLQGPLTYVRRWPSATVRDHTSLSLTILRPASQVDSHKTGSMVPIPLYRVDAFTDQPFAGNPAAVCLIHSHHHQLTDDTKQSIAAEMNLSETSFVELQDPSSNGKAFQTQSAFRLRWFTPVREALLCGHATLAAAAALIAEGNEAELLSFETRFSGTLKVARTQQQGRQLLQMSLPLNMPDAPVPESAGKSSPLVQALMGSKLHWVEEVRLNSKLKHLMVVLHKAVHPQELTALPIDHRAGQNASTDGAVRAVCITCRGTFEQDNYDIYTRNFAPWGGIDEDPVTGAAHSVIASYWAEVLGKAHLKARQCSKRGGNLWLEVDRDVGRVLVSGAAVIVSKGQLFL